MDRGVNFYRVCTLLRSSNSMASHDFFKSFKTSGLVVTFKKFQNFPCFGVFFDRKQFNRKKLWCSPKWVAFSLFDYFCLSYIVLALSSAVTKLQNKTLIFHDFQGPIIKFNDFPAWKKEILKFHDLPGFHDLYEPCFSSNRFWGSEFESPWRKFFLTLYFFLFFLNLLLTLFFTCVVHIASSIMW